MVQTDTEKIGFLLSVNVFGVKNIIHVAYLQNYNTCKYKFI